jgi:hypothetical protein
VRTCASNFLPAQQGERPGFAYVRAAPPNVLRQAQDEVYPCEQMRVSATTAASPNQTAHPHLLLHRNIKNILVNNL